MFCFTLKELSLVNGSLLLQSIQEVQSQASSTTVVNYFKDLKDKHVKRSSGFSDLVRCAYKRLLLHFFFTLVVNDFCCCDSLFVWITT